MNVTHGRGQPGTFTADSGLQMILWDSQNTTSSFETKAFEQSCVDWDTKQM